MKSNESLDLAMSLIYIKNKSGPGTDPCGTPVDIFRVSDFILSHSTNCSLFER